MHARKLDEILTGTSTTTRGCLVEKGRAIGDAQVGDRLSVMARGDFSHFVTVSRVTDTLLITGEAGKEVRWRRKDGKRSGDSSDSWSWVAVCYPAKWHLHEYQRSRTRQALEMAADRLTEGFHRGREYTDEQKALMESAEKAARALVAAFTVAKEPSSES